MNHNLWLIRVCDSTSPCINLTWKWTILNQILRLLYIQWSLEGSTLKFKFIFIYNNLMTAFSWKTKYVDFHLKLKTVLPDINGQFWPKTINEANDYNRSCPANNSRSNDVDKIIFVTTYLVKFNTIFFCY